MKTNEVRVNGKFNKKGRQVYKENFRWLETDQTEN